MQVKTITYKRILNLGNYEAKHLEETWELSPTDDLEAETSRLMEFVERKIREESDLAIESEIRQAKKRLRELKKELQEAEQQIAAANSQLQPSPHPGEASIDDIPFETGDTPVDSGGVLDGF